jgi:hypothetical protein
VQRLAVPSRLGIDMLLAGAGAVDTCGRFPAAVKAAPKPCAKRFFRYFSKSGRTLCLMLSQLGQVCFVLAVEAFSACELI